MTIIDAIMSGRRIRRPIYAFFAPASHYAFTHYDVVAEDWETEIEPEPEKTVTVTRSQVLIAIERTRVASREPGGTFGFPELLCKALGL